MRMLSQSLSVVGISLNEPQGGQKTNSLHYFVLFCFVLFCFALLTQTAITQLSRPPCSFTVCVAVCCSALQCVAVCCSVCCSVDTCLLLEREPQLEAAVSLRKMVTFVTWSSSTTSFFV